MSKQLWFYEMMSQEFGPVPSSEIQQLIADGMLSSGDRVRSSSSDEWITAAEIANAEADAAAADEAEDLPNIDDFTFESPQNEPPPPVRPVSPEPEPEPAEDEYAEPEFYIQSLGHVLGPLTQHELVEMAISGSVTRGDEIRDGEDGSWIAVETIPALQAEIMRQSSASSDSSAAVSAKPKPKEKKPKERPRKKTASRKKTTASGKPMPPKRRKRKKPRTDDFLQEIFSEVFTTEGKLRDDLKTETPKPAAGVNAGVSDAGAASTAPTPAMNPAASTMAASASPANSTGAGFAPAPAQPARPAFRPSPSKKSGGFEMPDPKVLGIAGGVLAVVLLVAAGFMGMLPSPGPSVDATSFFTDFTTALPEAQGGTKEDWDAFRKRFAPAASGLITGLRTRAQTDPEAQQQHKAARLAYQIMALSHDETFDQNETLSELKSVLASGG